MKRANLHLEDMIFGTRNVIAIAIAADAIKGFHLFRLLRRLKTSVYKLIFIVKKNTLRGKRETKQRDILFDISRINRVQTALLAC